MALIYMSRWQSMLSDCGDELALENVLSVQSGRDIHIVVQNVNTYV